MPMWRFGANPVGNACDGLVNELANASRAQGIGAREKYIARPSLSLTTFTTLGLKKSPATCKSCAAVAIAAVGLSCKACATAITNDGSMSGSSPCKFTTMASSGQPRYVDVLGNGRRRALANRRFDSRCAVGERNAGRRLRRHGAGWRSALIPVETSSALATVLRGGRRRRMTTRTFQLGTQRRSRKMVRLSRTT